MTYKANVVQSFPDSVNIYLGNQTNNGFYVAKFRHMEYELKPAGVESSTFLSLNDSEARALMDALHRYFGSPSDMQTLRADYLHERGRLDKILDKMLGIQK